MSASHAGEKKKEKKNLERWLSRPAILGGNVGLNEAEGQTEWPDLRKCFFLRGSEKKIGVGVGPEK